MTFQKLKKLAESAFQKKDYSKALHYYALALAERPGNKELKIGAMLCDLAEEMPEEAHALFDYYLIARKENRSEAETLLEQILASIDTNITIASNLIADTVRENAIYENGISYEDFLEIVRDKENFKEAFEDVIFSTKVVLTDKDEFLAFLDLLIDNGYGEMALSYIEGANALFPLDDKIREMLVKISRSRTEGGEL